MRIAPLLLGVVLAGWGGALALAQAGGPIPERKNDMKAMQRELEAMKAALDSGDIAAIAPRAKTVHGLLEVIPTLFPPDLATGDTKALPAVWSDRAGFETAARNALAASGKLEQAASSGDRAATVQAFREMGASCGGCHRSFRGR